MRMVISFATLWACLIIESTVFQIPPINVVQPDFILVSLIVLALVRGARYAMVFGVLIGLVQDAVFSTFLGLNAFTYGVIAYFAGAAFSQFLHRNVAVTFLITVIATAIQEWFTFGLMRMFEATAYTWQTVLVHSLWQMIQNGLLLLLLYPILTRLFGLKTKPRYPQGKPESS